MSNVSAKRAPPAKIKPLQVNGSEIRFEVNRGDCQKNKHCGMQMFLVSKGKTNWKTGLYQKAFNLRLETDVQEIHPRTLKLAGKEIVVIDERGSTYQVGLDGKLIRPLKSIIYSVIR